MPRAPHAVSQVARIPEAIYSPFDGEGPPGSNHSFPLHVGDTWLTPFEGARVEDLRAADYPELNRYTDTRGIPELVDALVEKVRARNRLACERESVLVTGGATAGLAAAVGALAAPGEEVLLLAPFWPLIRGIVRTFRACPVEVPFYDRVDGPEAAVEAVRERITPRTAALYVSTPSNPTGRVLPDTWLAALAECAHREGLWIISDEVYEDYIYRGEHVSIARFAPDSTVTAFSFSKAYGMAGNRTGYLAGPPDVVSQIRKVSTHTVYCAPAAGQVAGLRAIRKGGDWLEEARSLYQAAGEDAARVLGLPSPEGSTFLFLNVEQSLDERGLAGLLRDCFEEGVLVAPGASGGEAYGNWIRLCYTACPPEGTAEAVRRLARRVGAPPRGSRRAPA
jgi:N-succinyldiaminopimelate aminotransferase